jgi:CubicO group peptidase (beta-lactamase class C family)
MVAVYQRLLSEPLEFAPGSTHRYSNAGHGVLRLVLEHAAGEDYEGYIQKKVLRPMGITRMRLERKGGYAPDETHRYQAGGTKPARYPVANWLATAEDLVRFGAAVGGSGGKLFLSPRLTATVLGLPPPPIKPNQQGAYVGLGWDSVRKFRRGYHFAKNGAKPGVHASLEHMEYDVDWALLFNTSPPEGPSLVAEARNEMYRIFANAVAAGRGKS